MTQLKLNNNTSLLDANCITIESLKCFNKNDLSDLCDATLSVLENSCGFSIGFHRSSFDKESLEQYFNGILIIPERSLIVGRYDGIIAGSIQLLKPPNSNQTSAFSIYVDNHFVAPWARGLGLAKALLMAAEEEAKIMGYSMIKLSVRATQDAAINLYDSFGYKKWGTLDKYELMDGKIIAGHFYYKDL
ncbi:MAG: GNAT family N-acetyltransferase [Alphaproteobacteria bacterium]